jgi:hypothetical protein
MLNSHNTHESVSDRVLIISLEKFKQENLSKKHPVARSGFDMQHLAECISFASPPIVESLVAVSSCENKFKTILQCRGKQEMRFKSAKVEYKSLI